MGSTVRHSTGFGHAGKAGVIAGFAAALLGTGTATAASMTPTHMPAAAVGRPNLEAHYTNSKPRTGSGRDQIFAKGG